jgi:hypothetical protein
VTVSIWTASASLETITVTRAVEALIAAVRSRSEGSDFFGNSQSLLALLEAARTSFAQGHFNSGLRQLRSVRNQIAVHWPGDAPPDPELADAVDQLIVAVSFGLAVR